MFNQFKKNFQQNDLWNEWKATKTSTIYGLGIYSIVTGQELEQKSPKKGRFFSFQDIYISNGRYPANIPGSLPGRKAVMTSS